MIFLTVFVVTGTDIDKIQEGPVKSGGRAQDRQRQSEQGQVEDRWLRWQGWIASDTRTAETVGWDQGKAGVYKGKQGEGL